jgi:fatty-acid desaturase
MRKLFGISSFSATASAWVTQTLSIYALYLVVCGYVPFLWVLLSFLVYMVIQLSITVGCHRLFTHRTYECSRGWHTFFATVCALSLHATSITWTQIHTLHHRFVDTDKDPQISSWKFFFLRNFRVTDAPSGRNVASLIRDPMHRFLHNYSLLLSLIFASALYLINPMLCLFGYIVPVGAHFFATACLIVFGHWGGVARDLWWMEFIIPIGEWQHYDHHNTDGVCKQWDFGKFDLGSYLIRAIKQK